MTRKQGRSFIDIISSSRSSDVTRRKIVDVLDGLVDRHIASEPRIPVTLDDAEVLKILEAEAFVPGIFFWFAGLVR